MSADNANQKRYDIPQNPHTGHHTPHALTHTRTIRAHKSPTHHPHQHKAAHNTYTHTGATEKGRDHERQRNTPTHTHDTATPPPQANPGQERWGISLQGPQPGVARDESRPQSADPSQGWRGTAPTALSQEWRGTTHHHNQRTRARSGGASHPQPSARSGEGPPTTTTGSGPRAGVAGHRNQDPQP